METRTSASATAVATPVRIDCSRLIGGPGPRGTSSGVVAAAMTAARAQDPFRTKRSGSRCCCVCAWSLSKGLSNVHDHAPARDRRAGGTILILLDQGNSSRRIDADNRHRDVSSSRSRLVLTRGAAEPRALPVRAAGVGGTGLVAGRGGASAFTGAAAAWAFSSSWSRLVLMTDWPTLVGMGRGMAAG